MLAGSLPSGPAPRLTQLTDADEDRRARVQGRAGAFVDERTGNGIAREVGVRRPALRARPRSAGRRPRHEPPRWPPSAPGSGHRRGRSRPRSRCRRGRVAAAVTATPTTRPIGPSPESAKVWSSSCTTFQAISAGIPIKRTDSTTSRPRLARAGDITAPALVHLEPGGEPGQVRREPEDLLGGRCRGRHRAGLAVVVADHAADSTGSGSGVCAARAAAFISFLWSRTFWSDAPSTTSATDR